MGAEANFTPENDPDENLTLILMNECFYRLTGGYGSDDGLAGITRLKMVINSRFFSSNDTSCNPLKTHARHRRFCERFLAIPSCTTGTAAVHPPRRAAPVPGPLRRLDEDPEGWMSWSGVILRRMKRSSGPLIEDAAQAIGAEFPVQGSRAADGAAEGKAAEGRK
jgi:hypothetical protein